MTTTRVALVQRHCLPFEVEQNRAASLAALSDAFEQQADVVVLPEMTVPGYALDRERLWALAEPLDGPTVTAWAAAAKQGNGMVVGGFCERSGDHLFNSAVVLGPNGLELHYRKLHLFGTEKEIFSPGDLGLPVVETPRGRVGVCVCYDLRFVEVVRALALRDVDIVLVPTAWVGGFDAQPVAHGQLSGQAQGALLQANLNQVFIACASQSGAHEQFRFLGNTVIADPYGVPSVAPLSDTDEGLVVVDIDLSDAAKARRRGDLITPRDDRRRDVYGLWYRDTVL